MRTLFDAYLNEPAQPEKPRVRQPVEVVSPPSRRLTAKQYELMTRWMIKEQCIRVRKWRSSTSGAAWQLIAPNGEVTRMIEAPRPRGPMSAAVFLHEVGHHAIGFDRYKPRCLEEYHAWMYSLQQMARWGIPITEQVQFRVYDCLHYAVDKAKRRGLRMLPPELVPYLRYRRDRS